MVYIQNVGLLVGWLSFTFHRKRGQLETAPTFTVPCEGCEARFLHRFHRESNPGPSCGSPLHYRCATTAPLKTFVVKGLLNIAKMGSPEDL